MGDKKSTKKDIKNLSRKEIKEIQDRANKAPVETFPGANLEYALRGTGDRPGPRILSLDDLQRGGLSAEFLISLWNLCYGKNEAYDLVRASGKGFTPVDGIREKMQDPRKPHVGNITVNIAFSQGVRRVVKAVRDHPSDDFRMYAKLLLIGFLESYVADTYPLYIHCVVKDSIICPMPVPYAEIFIAGDYSTSNAFAYFGKDGDTPDLTIL